MRDCRAGVSAHAVGALGLMRSRIYQIQNSRSSRLYGAENCLYDDERADNLGKMRFIRIKKAPSEAQLAAFDGAD